MESFSSSRVIYESNLWNSESIHQNSVVLDDLLLSMDETSNVQCSSCNMKQDRLAKREELAWQREDMILSREKELRERELILQEKDNALIEREKKLKYKEAEVLNTEAICDPRESSEAKKSSVSDIAQCTVSLEQQVNSNQKNGLLLERETLLQEKEKIMSEKVSNIEKREHNISFKEELLNNQKLTMNRENILATQNEQNLELRTQIVKTMEEGLDAKLEVIFEEKRILDEREKLLIHKENAMLASMEIIQNREHDLDKRESIIIEKEKSIIKKINELISSAKHPVTNNSEQVNEIRKFDDIFNDKWKSVQQKENAVSQSELILQEKWKEYSKAKELLNSEEESLLAMKDTFQKENTLLRWMGKFAEKEGIKNIKADNTEKTDKDLVSNKTSSAKRVSYVHDFRRKGGVPFYAVEQEADCQMDSKCSGTDENVMNKTPCSENREIPGNELVQFNERAKQLLENLVLPKNTEMMLKEFQDTKKNAGNNSELTESVQAFFEKTSISKRPSETKSEDVKSLPDANKRKDLLPSGSGVINQEAFVQENIQNKIALDSNSSSSINSGDVLSPDSDSNSIKNRSLPLMLDTVTDKENLMSSSSSLNPEADEFKVIMGGNIVKQFVTSKMNAIPEKYIEKIKLNTSTSSKGDTDTARFQKNEIDSESQNSEKSEKSKLGTVDVCLSNSNVSETLRNDVLNTCPISSASSTRNCTSPVSGRSTPSDVIGRKKAHKDALLQAISNKNYLATVQLLDTNCMSLEIRNTEGRSAFLLAVESGDIDLVQRLMDKGADVNACDYKGCSALHIAVSKKNVNMMNFLLKKGLNPRVTDNNGMSALQLTYKLKVPSLTEHMNKYIAEKSS